MITAAMALRELKSKRCACRKKKKPTKSLCTACYFTLPKSLQVALYQRIGEGYEAAYANALTYLGHQLPGPQPLATNP